MLVLWFFCWFFGSFGGSFGLAVRDGFIEAGRAYILRMCAGTGYAYILRMCRLGALGVAGCAGGQEALGVGWRGGSVSGGGVL